ncbi:MAG TPA: hypothetical protein PLP17_11055, partial [Oligoflexia bacterium]|nr:hypothetical protein [Oligoflexia bacterium]
SGRQERFRVLPQFRVPVRKALRLIFRHLCRATFRVEGAFKRNPAGGIVSVSTPFVRLSYLGPTLNATNTRNTWGFP